MKRFFAGLTLMLVLSAIGCSKDEPTGCIIIAKDANNKFVPGANIHLHAKDLPPPKEPGKFEYKGKTDSEGKAYFDIPLEAIYTVDAVKDSLSGFTRVKIRAHETAEVTVILE